MNNLPLQDLIVCLEKELYRLHYTDQSVKYYRMMWRRIVTFFKNEGVDHFSEEIGMRFLKKQYNFFELEEAGMDAGKLGCGRDKSDLAADICIEGNDMHRDLFADAKPGNLCLRDVKI